MPREGSLLDLLDARAGIVCAVGAGGKKSLLRHLATTHPGRVAITSTVFTTYFQEQLGFSVVVEDDERLPSAVAAVEPGRSVAYACPTSTPARRAGVDPATIERIHREGGFAATFVKADGARMRLVKAPAGNEPMLVPGTTTVVPILSALAIGEPLTSRLAHRLECCERVADLRENEPIQPAQLARLLASPQGLMKATEGLRVVPLINMVDDAGREKLARTAAEIALESSDRIERVVLACLARTADPLVAVIER
ncbi:MAG TPA: selenium cofactor biosynthesis protein YqeC [Steroidobacteraceae bacterium]|nr:selenium cofactor biosynthesis protein YqeC [Steroidobacteraceae bacterium]